jgi:hypothetical protein
MSEQEREALIIAFIQGAKFWEYKSSGETFMLKRDLIALKNEAKKRADADMLGKIQTFEQKP